MSKQGLDASGPMGDAMLGMMVQAGLIASPQGVDIAANGLVTVDPPCARSCSSRFCC